ncbi:MAG: NAD-dependent epimerase/dehydratase family protein [Acidimicrobiia bacterium]
MQIAVTGGTGFIGRNVAALLAAEGHEIVLVARGVENRYPAVRLLPGVTLVRASVAEEKRLRDAFSGCDAVVHLAGIYAESPTQTFHGVHVEGTRNALAASRLAGVRRFVTLSPCRARPGTGSPLHDSKWEAEEIVRASGIDHVVARAGVVYGPEDHLLDGLSRSLATRPLVPLFGLRRRVVRPVAVTDVVRVLAAATSGRAVPAAVRVVGPDEMHLTDLVRAVGAAVDRRAFCLRIPGWLHHSHATALERLLLMTIASRTGEAAPWADPPPPQLAPRARFTTEVIRRFLPAALRAERRAPHLAA